MYHRGRSARAPFRLAVSAALLGLAISAASLFAPGGALPVARAATWTVDTSARTEVEVRAMWDVLEPGYSGGAYAVTPSWVAPYAPGELASGFRTDGVSMINFGRYLAGLPYDVTLTGPKNTSGQYGAVLLRVIGGLNHYPAQPAGMDDAFYQAGYAATSTSNIGSGYTTSHSFQKGCLDDASASNLPAVGHRRWLLNPAMLYSGIGYADGFHTTLSTDRSRPAGEVDYDIIAWPSAGVFPVEFTNRLTPWSITLNPDKYDWDVTAVSRTVTLRRVSDGTTWTMDPTDTNTSGEYFNANFGGFGVANAFIFRPNPADLGTGYKAGEQYDVTLSGGIYAQGTRTPVVVTYRTSFGALSGAATAFATDPTTPADPVVPAPTTRMPVYRFYNKVNGSHFYTASAAECDTVMATYAATYAYEGVAYQVDTANPVNCAPLYRFYNKTNGSHFYTPSADERDSVKATLSAIYIYEGPAYNVAVTSAGTTPMYRFYNRVNGSHFYTISDAERASVIRDLADRYTYEGINYYLGN